MRDGTPTIGFGVESELHLECRLDDVREVIRLLAFEKCRPFIQIQHPVSVTIDGLCLMMRISGFC